MNLRIAGVEKESVVDGPGLRYVIFVQGCEHNCPGCHNPETHDQNGGRMVSLTELAEDIYNRKLLTGVTFSGGEPFLQAKPLALLAQELKKKNYHIVTYTGYLFEELLAMSALKPEMWELLKLTDWLIDGPFMLGRRDLNLPYRGSSNQRIIEISRYLEQGILSQSKLA